MATTTVNNPEFVDRAFERKREREAERMEAASEHADTWAQIQGKLDSLARPITVVGAEVEMRPVGADATIRALEEAGGLAEDEREELEAAARGDPEAADIQQLADQSKDIKRLMQTIADMLDEFCTDPSMDRERWGQVPPQFLMEAFEEWSQRRLTPEEIERVNSFRGE